MAIACEQDLTSGIQETSPLPVLGILNPWPNGPCYNTDLDRNLLEKAVVNFLYGKAEVENYVEKGQGLVQNLKTYFKVGGFYDISFTILR